MSYALICAGLLALLPDENVGGTVDPRQTYRELRAASGRSADAQVGLALWCEAHGLTAERLHHLALAVIANPGHARARGLMGLVNHDGRFQAPEAVAEKVQADPVLAEYDARRAKAGATAEGQWALGMWAENHGLADQARAHFAAVTRLDPRRSDAWKQLGYRAHEGRWLTDQQWLAERTEVEEQKRADRKWRPILEDWRRQLVDPTRRVKAETGLAGVEDPRAVPAIVRVFGLVGPEQPRAVQLLGQIEAPKAARALATLAVAARSAKARRAATETLRTRDPRDYADLLIALLGDPIRFEVKHVAGLNSPGELLVEGQRVNLRRVYTPPASFQPGDHLGLDETGRAVVFRRVEVSTVHIWANSALDLNQARLAGMTQGELRRALPMMEQSLFLKPVMPTTGFYIHLGGQARIPLASVVAEAQKSAVATEQRLREDVRMLEDHNVAVRSANDRVAGVLNDATHQALPASRAAWKNWFVDQVGYASSSSDWTTKATVIENVAIAHDPAVIPEGAEREILDYDRHSCFAAGTMVQTIAGGRPIESLQVGDRVLTQNTTTAALGYKPVLVVHKNPPSPTFRIKLGGQPIVASPFHRFWIVGRGWVMARNLKPGDSIRTLGGVAPVESIDPDAVQPVFNLDVAEDADYFAGSTAALVHDNTLPDPRAIPFDVAPPTVAAKAAR